MYKRLQKEELLAIIKKFADYHYDNVTDNERFAYNCLVDEYSGDDIDTTYEGDSLYLMCLGVLKDMFDRNQKKIDVVKIVSKVANEWKLKAADAQFRGSEKADDVYRNYITAAAHIVDLIKEE